ncbi:peptide/nickel transport system substrate-binding protein [Jeotgalicoccus aerolatus]|uniref:Peptide/nickel transport system substrate-binding protein n=2 Tax=Jeotgalicoccus aerolatus TaxID=709510 RepID=A0A1G8XLI0_9STAP|nr:peptide/nickel transport system substrate-binding protein [Jeotgalicoccus aerolatus]
MFMQKKIWLFMLFAMLLIVAACTDDSDVDEAAEGESSGDASGNDLVIGMINEAVSLDPHVSNDIPSAQLRTQIFDTLVEQDVDMEFGEGLATSFEQDEDQWTLQLKEGVTFHNGSDFTAEDVEATLDRVMDPSVGSSVAFMFEMINDIEIVSDHEIVFTTDYPFTPLPSHLAHNTAGILSKEIIDEDYQNALDEAGSDVTLEEYYELREAGGEEFEAVSEEIGSHVGAVISENPDGTGHLKLQERVPGNEIVLEKFEEFHGGEREFDTVTYRVIPENSARLAELETGGIGITDNVDTEAMDRVREHEETDIIDQDGLSMTYVAFNYEKEPFNDENVRKAISHAIDREQIISGVLNDRGLHAKNHISPSVFAHNEDMEEVPYDLDMAKEYMADSSVPDGFDTVIWTSDSEQNRDIALIIQESLAELNINVEIEQYEHGAFLEMANQGDHDMFMLQWITVTGDPNYGLYPMFHTDSVGSGNRWNYSNPELDSYLEEGQRTSEDEERIEAYATAQEILMEDLPITPLYYGELGIGVNNTLVEGVELDPVGIVRIENVTFPE